MADIAKIILPNGDTYEIKDNIARAQINNIISNYATKTESSNHVVASKTQPTSQSAGDIWLIIKSNG